MESMNHVCGCVNVYISCICVVYVQLKLLDVVLVRILKDVFL